MTNITGIIAEYNPFHKGHQYHINQARKETEADAIIVVMSGDFVQRGTCAIADKYSRAEAALCSGADLVIELPVLYALSSADYFAGGAVSLLNQLGIVTHLAFGSESSEDALFAQIADLLIHEPEGYREILQKKLTEGDSFPKAREMAVTQYLELADAAALLSLPNNILAIEYHKHLQRLGSGIKPVHIRRLGAGYHQCEPDTLYSSATGIREQVRNEIKDEHSMQKIEAELPESSYEILKKAYGRSFPVYDEDISSYVHHALLSVRNHDYSIYLDVSDELSNRIRNHIHEYCSFHQFAMLLKTKELTYSRICRCLIHILLDMRKDVFGNTLNTYQTPYVRVLGMGKKGAELLKAIRTCTNSPLIMNPAEHALSGEGKEMLALDCHAAHIWNGAAMDKFKEKMPNEYCRKFLKNI